MQCKGGLGLLRKSIKKDILKAFRTEGQSLSCLVNFCGYPKDLLRGVVIQLSALYSTFFRLLPLEQRKLLWNHMKVTTYKHTVSSVHQKVLIG